MPSVAPKMPSVARNRAWVTLLTEPSYLPGAIVLDYSLRAVHSKYPLLVMVTPGLSGRARQALSARRIEMVEVDDLDVTNRAMSFKEKRFKDTWTKLRCFQLDQFERLVLIDSDMLVRKNMDELLEMPLEEEWIAAVHACACNPRKIHYYPADWVPENCAYTNANHPPSITKNSPRPYGQLNSGLVVLTPARERFEEIHRFLEESPLVPTFMFPDQDLLAEFFKGKWEPLPYIYNALKTLRVIHKNVWVDDDVKNIHYILSDKPWTKRPAKDRKLVFENEEFHETNLWWWKAYDALQSEVDSRDAAEDKHHHWAYVKTLVAS